ncbi:phage portal protein [Paenibacillus polymyxa]|uniref:phage tail assembly chaperone n=1 Tax=Paenibacillus polymyxa TaxID=1406 RepID=UPI00307E3DB1
MSQFSAFFKENASVDVTEEVIVSERFKDKNGKLIPWKIQGISETQNKAIRKSATKMIKGKGGVKVPEIDSDEYMTKLVIASVIYPNLKDAELQENYGVAGADNLLNKMLLSGEFATLWEKVQELNGYDKDINEVMEETKNS